VTTIDTRLLDVMHDFTLSVPVALIATDASGTVTHWSPHAERLYGWSADDAIGMLIQQLTVGPDTAEVAEEIMAKLGRGEHWEGEFTASTREGDHIDVHVFDFPVVDDTGAVVGICGLSMDVSPHRAPIRADAARSRELVDAVHRAVEDERERIAATLHDDVQQVVAAARTEVGALDSGALAPAESLPRVAANLDRALTALQTISADLQPPLLADFGLAAAVQALASDLGRRSGMRCDIRVAGFEQRLAHRAEIEVFRVAEEALSNAERHAGARTVQVTLTRPPEGWAVLRVADDGSGTDLQRSSPTATGISTMHERARRLGGTLQIAASEDGTGTVVTLEFPTAD
jgi:PAS domain S-box-containing protein